MPKQIYIDENGNELLVSGTINTGDMLPITSGSSTNTKSYIDNKTADDIEYSSGVTVGDKLDSLDANKLSKGDIRTLTGTGVTDANGIITSTALGIAQLDYIHHLILGVQSNTNGCVVNVGQYNQNFYYLCSNASNISVPMANTSVTITVIYMYK